MNMVSATLCKYFYFDFLNLIIISGIPLIQDMIVKDRSYLCCHKY